LYSVEFKEDSLVLLDQTKLPFEKKYLKCKSVGDVCSAIRTMIVRGAPAIGVAAAYGLVFAKDLPTAAKKLKDSRPTAVDLFNAVDYVVAQVGEGKAVLEAAKSWHELIIAKTRKICEHGSGLVTSDSTIILHCNAGPIATAALGTSLGAVIFAAKSKKVFAYVDETRPRFQGSLTSWELTEAGVDHKVIVDSSAGFLMKQGRIRAVAWGETAVHSKIGAINLLFLEFVE